VHGHEVIGADEEHTRSILEPAYYQEQGPGQEPLKRHEPALYVDKTNAVFVYTAAEGVLGVKGIRGAMLHVCRHKKAANTLLTCLNQSGYHSWQTSITVDGWNRTSLAKE